MRPSWPARVPRLPSGAAAAAPAAAAVGGRGRAASARDWAGGVMWVPVSHVAPFLASRHYLGPARRGRAWSDEFGVLVLASPTSRRLPTDGTWLELTRWCLLGAKNGGSQQWSRVVPALLGEDAAVTTIVSYSDPSQGHTGALYRACNWVWAPTWHRLRTPPTGNGSWAGGKPQAAKDRWVYPIRRDARRAVLLAVQDESLRRRGCPSYQEPKRWWPKQL